MSEIEIAGVPVTVASEAECEAVDAVLCVRKGADTPFDNNLEAPCSVCGETVIFRPYAPKTPPKICMECALEMMGSTRQ